MSVTHAYSLDLHSPPDMSRQLELSTHGVEHLQPGAPNLMDSGDLPVLMEQHHPVLQPVIHTGMCYPPQAPAYNSNIRGGAAGLKIEKPDEDFQGHDLHISPVYMQTMDAPQSALGMPQQDLEPYHLQPTDEYALQYHTHTPHGFVSPDTAHPYFYPLVLQGDEGSGMIQSQKPTPTKRGPFKDKEKRDQTAATRKMGSCIRCRMQRIRVR